jgi:importin subunit beta-1
MLAVGALAHSVGKDLQKYMEALYPFVEVGLKNHEEFSVCQATVGVVGDICRALDEKLAQWCDNIVFLLLQDLQSSELHRAVKPPILSCFGDIALAVGPSFDKYLEFVLPMLQSATSLAMTNQDPNVELDEDTVQYKNDLRNGIFEAYTGILQGFRDDKSKIASLAQHARFILSFIEDVSKDPYRDASVTRNMIALLGDMADTMDGIGELFKEKTFYQALFQELHSQSSDDTNFDSTLHWASERIALRLTQ